MEVELHVVVSQNVQPPGVQVAEWPLTSGHTLRAFREGERRWLDVAGVGSCAFEAEGPAEMQTELESSLVRDLWLRSLLPLVVQARGTEVLHASALRGARGVVVLCGRSKAGKSTLAASVANKTGLRIVADDAIAVHPGTPAVALPLPFRLRLRPDAARTLGSAPVPLERLGHDSPAPLASIFILDPDGAERPAAADVPPSHAVGALMPHAYCFDLADSKERLLDSYSAVCRDVPVLRFAYPRGLDTLNATADALATLVADAST